MARQTQLTHTGRLTLGQLWVDLTHLETVVGQQRQNLHKSHSLIAHQNIFSEHLHQVDLSMLALRVVTVRVFVVLNASFTSKKM